MKAKVLPLRFKTASVEEFDKISALLAELYGGDMELLPPANLGDAVPEGTDAVLFPVMWSDVYEDIDKIEAMGLPVLVMTTKYGVSLMFDWESVAFMKSKGLMVFNPHSEELARTVLKALALKRAMKHQKFLVFQDTPGDGLLPEIFKVFYWWTDECTQTIRDKFGIEIVRKPYKDVCEKAKAITDEAAREEWKRWDFKNEIGSERPALSALKLFMAIRDAVDEEGDVVACGANCLNEAYDSNTTPCLAWSLLYKDRGVMGVCEGDTSALMTQYLVGRTIDAPVLTTNIYPFLSGMPALSHEKIQSFPDVADPDDHALLVHCGYFGMLPEAMSNHWALKPCVLGWLVGENSVAVDAEFDVGDITLCKLHNTFDAVFVEKAELEAYVQYPGSDCHNGALIRVPDGYKLMEKIPSHHVIVMTGKRANQIRAVAEIFGMGMSEAY